MRLFSLIACLFVVTSFVSGCSNTLNGAGQDIEKAGEKVQDTF